MLITDLLGNVISGANQGMVMPFVSVYWPNTFANQQMNGSAGDSFGSQAIGAETPRDHQMGFMRFTVPWHMRVIGYVTSITNVFSGTVVPGLNSRLCVYSEAEAKGLPDSPIAGSDTGAVTITQALTNAGNWKDNSGGRGKCRWNVSGYFDLFAGYNYWRGLAIEQVYTGEAAYACSGYGITYEALGGSATAGLRRAFGLPKVEGATSSLSAWTLPAGRGSDVANFADLNGRAEATGSVGLICARVA